MPFERRSCCTSDSPSHQSSVSPSFAAFPMSGSSSRVSSPCFLLLYLFLPAMVFLNVNHSHSHSHFHPFALCHLLLARQPLSGFEELAADLKSPAHVANGKPLETLHHDLMPTVSRLLQSLRCEEVITCRACVHRASRSIPSLWTERFKEHVGQCVLASTVDSPFRLRPRRQPCACRASSDHLPHWP